ncbi:hypothetical protein, partial [Meiothermus taiwanensis]
FPTVVSCIWGNLLSRVGSPYSLSLRVSHVSGRAQKRTSPKNRLAKELLLDIATGVAAALLLVLFICLVPTF